MMTKEEVAQIITYCDENKISYKQYQMGSSDLPLAILQARSKHTLSCF